MAPANNGENGQHEETSSSDMLMLHRHILSSEGPSTTFVKEKLGKFPNLLLEVDNRDDTLLHLAIRYGYSDIAKVLLESARYQEPGNRESAVSNMLKMKNKDGNTALDEALERCNTEVVKILIREEGQEFLDVDKISKILNHAAKLGDHAMVTAIEEAFADRPGGKANLQEAILEIRNISGSESKDTILQMHIRVSETFETRQSTMFVQKILDICPSLLVQVNALGDTPLHVAVARGSSYMVKLLLKQARDQSQDLEDKERDERQDAESEGQDSGSEEGDERQDSESEERADIKMLKMKNMFGQTALDLALQSGNTEVLTVLICDAAETGDHEMVTTIAELTKGKRALHQMTNNTGYRQSKDTILHMHISVSRTFDTTQSTTFVQKILDICPSLLLQVNANNDTPLHVAATYEHSAYMVKLLLKRARDQRQDSEGDERNERQDSESKKRADIEMLKMKNKDGDTALDIAVGYKHTEVVKILICEAGPGFLYFADNIDKILHLAVEKEDLEIVTAVARMTKRNTALRQKINALIKHDMAGSQSKDTILHTHINTSKHLREPLFAEKILDICPSLLLEVNANGDTPLHVAARLEYTENMVKLLLERARDQGQDLEGEERADTKMLKMKNNAGNTVLDVAVERGNAGVVKMLICEAGNEILRVAKNVDSILNLAAQRGDCEIVTESVIEKAGYQGGTQTMNTILHTHMISAEKPSTTFVQEILRMYPSLIKQVDAKGNTPLHVAAERGYNNIAAVITDHAKAEGVLWEMLQVENNENNTAVHEAVIHCRTEIVKMLIREAGSWFSNFANSSGKTPLYLAFEREDDAMVIVMQTAATTAGPSASPSEILRAAAVNYALLGTQHSKDTILHIHIQSSQPSTEFVKRMLQVDSQLLHEANAEGDTPLHVAAKHGHSGIAEVLISQYQMPGDMHEIRQRNDQWQMLKLTNKEKNTSLHEAVRHGKTEVVKILTKDADPDFSYDPNDAGETPLYLAAAGGYRDMVAAILGSCKLAAHEGPNGMTALHAAVLYSDVEGPLCTMEAILQKKRSLTKAVDQYGWTALHYAAYYGLTGQVSLLLDFDKSAADIPDKDRKMTALHMAASRGYNDIVEEIISKCVKCCKMVDKRGWNVLHFAMLGLTKKEMDDLLKNPLVGGLIYKKDKDGNTPLHIRAAAYRDFVFHVGDRQVFNGENVNVEDILKHGSRKLEEEIQILFDEGLIRERNDDDLFKIRGDLRKKYEDGIKEIKSSHLLVATLIATVTFAAALTVPGGSSQAGTDQGTAILKSSPAFQTFIIADTIALTLSLSAVVVHFIMVQKFLRHDGLFTFASQLTMCAMLAMVFAFVTGIYAVLTPSSWLAILISCLGFIFFLIQFGALKLIDLRELNHLVGFIRRISRNGIARELTREKSTLPV